VADLWVLVHRKHGAIRTFLSLEDAARELRWVLRDEPDWEGDVWLEPFHVVVSEQTY
jgi:hypothetical protein